MLKVVSFFWGEKYTPAHVDKLYHALRKNLHIPFEYVLFTDKKLPINENIDQRPLWDKCRNLGGCYNRLYIFHEKWEKELAQRFICIDLDCVITGDITPIFSRQEDFIINAYQPLKNNKGLIDQRYNGAMFMMNAGARKSVWHEFDPKKTPKILKQDPAIVGTDQAWIRKHLGPGERTWNVDDGIYEARNLGHKLPANCRLVFFAGDRDPSTSRLNWVRHLWV